MRARRFRVIVPLAVVCFGGLLAASLAQDRQQGGNRQPRRQQPASQNPAPDRSAQDDAPAGQQPAARNAPADAVQDAQSPRDVPRNRPEQQQTEHDKSPAFAPGTPAHLSDVLKTQPNEGRILGFDFYRDPLGAPKPFTNPADVMKKESEARKEVMDAQRKLLESRYDLNPKLDPEAKMSRGKPLPVGPTARLADGVTWDSLAEMSPQEVREKKAFPYPSLPHPLHANGGQVFPDMQIEQFPRLKRFDVDFDLPDAFIPEFPPAIFLVNRPELGDVSRGEVVSINNFHRLFKDLLTPVQLEGLRLLLTPLPQEEFNATDDRKTVEPSLGVACFD